jgi:hypothetical protein
MLRTVLGCGIAVWVALGAGAWADDEFDPPGYAGTERCRACHPEKYAGWQDTFHATVIQDARKNPSAVLGDFSAPGLGFTVEDVEFTIGGHWDQRYMKKIGDEYFVLPKLWSVQSQSWRDYNVWSWRKKPYGKFCKGCHVTAYDPTANVPMAENRIGCEACHGPGWAHAESEGEKPMVNPKKLPEDRRDMICAACHVRGRDRSGTYYFPVGFVPGEDLGKYYVPVGKTEDESNSQAVLRAFAKWKKKRTSGTGVRCEVCGIPGKNQEQGKQSDGAQDFCFGCHDFKERYAEHTRHAAELEIVCFDCHVQQQKELMNPQNLDIHSYGYFLVHTDNCYDRRIEKTCANCHQDKGSEWAHRTVNSWRSPIDVHE